MAGYYDDFMGAVALPDDLNEPAVTYSSTKSHAGNAITGYAPLNPRHTYAWVEREDGATGRFNNFTLTGGAQYKTNAGIHEWLSYDQNRRDAGTYGGKAQIQSPDSITNANRQKYKAGADYATVVEGYLMFCNGYDTTNRYYAATGTNDATFGRDNAETPDVHSARDLDSDAGIPATASTPTKHIRTHLAGVYSGEVLYHDVISLTLPYKMLYPIHSPSGGNFLVNEIYTTSASYDPVLAYDGTLNSKGDGDIFTIRIHAAAVDTSSARIKLRIGCEGTAMTSTVSGETTYTNAAIEYEITPVGYQEFTGSYSAPTLTSLWDDYDFIINYTASTYDIYKNGASVSTGNSMSNKASGDAFTAADMYGWVMEAKNCSKKATVLLDRVGLIRPLNDHPAGTEMPPATKMTWNSTVNSTSSLNLTLIDDDAQLKLLSFFNQSSYSDWGLLMFRDNIARPLWRGFVTGLSYSQSASSSTPTITITANDSYKNLEHQIPVWELGKGGDADSTSAVAYNRSEAQNNLNLYYFGASRLTTANATLSFNEYEDGSGVFVKHKDSRMRNRSAHPIQMYLGEDSRGPNAPYSDWDAAVTAGHATSDAEARSIHSRWIKDIKLSNWFRHTFGKIEEEPLFSTTLASNFTKGSTTMVLTDAMPTITEGTSIEIIDGNGIVDSGIITAASATNITPFRIGWAYERVAANRKYYHIFEPRIYVRQSDISFSDFNKTFSVSGSAITEINGSFKLRSVGGNQSTKTINGVACYVMTLYNGNRAFVISSATAQGPYASAAAQDTALIPPTQPSNIPTGLNAISWTLYASWPSISTNTNNEPFVFFVGVSGTALRMGNTTCTLPATNFFQRDHAAGETVNIRVVSDDFKHIWVLWSDMRNDGNADADAGLRRSKFGLMTPYSSNHSVSLVYADQTSSAESPRQEFVDLAVGQDVDLWEMDAMADPLTGLKWSAVAGGSDAESNSKYHDWWNKAGSFVIIDTSKFFNLNTYTNSGMTGQIAGGRKEIGDYLLETEGFPVLIDNYWEKAPTTPFNLIDVAWNSNYKYFLSKPTTLKVGVEANDAVIQVNEDIIPDSVFGTYPSFTPTSIQLVSQEKNRKYHAAINNKWPAVATTGVAAASGGAGLVTLTTAANEGKRFRAGHTITISSSTTTPTIDGEYIIHSNQPVGAYPHFSDSLTIKIDPLVTLTGSGTCTITAENTYTLRTLDFLGKPVDGSTASGEWDGTDYGGTNSADVLIQATATNDALVSVPIDEDNSNAMKDLQVYWGLANVFPMRLMMQVNGFVENPASMTFAEHDKFRVTYMDSLTRNWMEQSALYGIPSIATIPVTNEMTTSQKSIVSVGSGGYIGLTGAGTNSAINTEDYLGGPVPHGLLVGDKVTIIGNAQFANDPDLDYRQDYTVTALSGATQFSIDNSFSASATNQDGIWRKAGEVDTFGSVNDARNATIASVFSTSQATAGISDTYGVRTPFVWLGGRDGRPSFRPSYGSGFVFNRNNLTVSNLKSQSSNQVSNVRVFYNGGVAFVDYPSASLGSRPRWDIISVPEVTSAAEALKVARQEYEKNKDAPLSITANIQRLSDAHNMGGTNDTMLYNARFGYIADQSRTVPYSRGFSSGTNTEDKAWAWFSLYGGNLFGGVTNALDGKAVDSAYLSSSNAAWNLNYFWYGSHSLSYALQVVDVPHGMPKTTDKTASGSDINGDGHLRFAIDIDDRNDFNITKNARFRVYLLDYDWDNATYEGALRSSSSITVDANGFYELPVPSTYWAAQTGDERVIISVNYDYLVSLLDNRCGVANRHKNAHNWAVSYSSFNTDSIFPLGVRKWGTADYWNLRSEWYAPRLHVVDDVNFTVGTGLDYTDSVLELSNEALQIRSLSWGIDGQNREDLTLTLERDMSRAARGGFANYVIPKTPKSPSTGGGGGSGGNAGGSNGGPAKKPDDGFPVGGQYDGWGDWGDEMAGALDNAKFTSNTNPQRKFANPDGLTSNSNAKFNIGANNMANNLTNAIKGVMEFNTDSMTGGTFGVLGQKKPSAPPRNNDGAYGLTMSPSSGDAVADDNGITFAGATDNTFPHSAFNTNVPVPPKVATDRIQISGRLTMGAASGNAVLFVTASVLETGLEYTSETTVAAVRQGNTVFFDDAVQGANINGNTLKITIARQAGVGDDTAQYGSVTIHNLQVGFDTQSVSGSGESSQLSY